MKLVHLRDGRVSEYTLQRVKLTDSTIFKPYSRCKECLADIKHKQREAKTPEERSAENARWNAKRDREHRRRYAREYERNRRREAGVPERGPWKQYRDSEGAHRCDVDYMLLPLPSGMTEQNRIQTHASMKLEVDPST
jgi:hypothetical protein